MVEHRRGFRSVLEWQAVQAKAAKASRRAMAQVLCKIFREKQLARPLACQAGGIWDERPVAKHILAWVEPDPRDVSIRRSHHRLTHSLTV